MYVCMFACDEEKVRKDRECVCVCVRERERERERDNIYDNERGSYRSDRA
jgi:hypothetical protein